MRRTISAGLAAALATTLLLGAGCTGDQDPPGAGAPAGQSPGVQPPPGQSPSVQPPSVQPPSLGSADADACAGARTAIGRSTDAYLAQLRKWVAAEHRAERDAALAATRRIFTNWSTALRTEAGHAADPKIKATLTEYAGGVRAVRDGLKKPADLERLENLDGSEIDVAANQLAKVCP